VKHLVVMIAVLAGASCATFDEETLSVVEEKIGTCANWDCGNTTDIWGRIPFGELDASGTAWNYAHVRVLAFHAADGTALHLVPDGDRIRGRRMVAGGPNPGGELYDGEALEGASLLLVDGGPTIHQIVIDRVSQVQSWSFAPARTTPTYRLLHGRYGTPRAEMLPVCPTSTPSEPVFVLPGVLMEAGDAVVFTGDRYDGQSKRVIATGAQVGRWFNIGCAGSVASKLHLMRHTHASADSRFWTMPAERQAVLKMFTADYCGTGRSFTVPGEPLRFTTRRQPMMPNPYPFLESIWSSEGAVCLDVPRREREVPGIRNEIAALCESVGRTLPPCGGMLATWTRRGYALTASRE
jgi:hypothetical protein